MGDEAMGTFNYSLLNDSYNLIWKKQLDGSQQSSINSDIKLEFLIMNLITSKRVLPPEDWTSCSLQC